MPLMLVFPLSGIFVHLELSLLFTCRQTGCILSREVGDNNMIGYTFIGIFLVSKNFNSHPWALHRAWSIA
jgi:hypothetical protein